MTQPPHSNTQYNGPKAKLKVHLFSSSQYSNKEFLENDSHAGSYGVLLFFKLSSARLKLHLVVTVHCSAESDYISWAAGVIMVRDVMTPLKENTSQGHQKDYKNKTEVQCASNKSQLFSL